MMGMWIAAWLDVQSKPLRTLTAIAGMVAAIVAVILVSAASNLSHAANAEYLARQYGRPVSYSLSTDDPSMPTENQGEIATRLRGAGIALVSVDVPVTLQSTTGSFANMGSATWVSSTYRDIRVVDMIAGVWPTDTAQSAVPHVVVSTAWAAETGYAPEQLIGQHFLVQHRGYIEPRIAPTFEVVIDGVAANSSNAFADTSVLIVSDLDAPVFFPEDRPRGWLVRTNPMDTGVMIDIVQGFTNSSGQPWYHVSRADATDTLAPVLNQQDVTGRAVALVALFIGGLGILGVGIASVQERAREFGVRRAIGASKLRIFLTVVVQFVLEVLLAAAIAVPLTAVLLELFARDLVLDTLPLPASITLPFESVVIGVGSALFVGLVASLIPAFTAARANVIQVLRG